MQVQIAELILSTLLKDAHRVINHRPLRHLFQNALPSKKTTTMFSGIIEETAKVVSLEKHQSNIDITLACSFVPS